MNFLQNLSNLQKRITISSNELLLLCLFFVTLSFGQLGRIHISSPVYFHDVVIFLWCISHSRLLITNGVKAIKSIDWKANWPGITFIFWVLLGIVLALFRTGDTLPLLYLGRITLYCVFLFSLYLRCTFDIVVLRILSVSAGMYMVAFGLLQYILLPDSRYWAAFGWDDHYYRLIGPLIDPNLSGILYVLLGWLLISIRKILPKPVWVILLLLTLCAIILTFSRASYLATIISAIFYGYVKLKQTKVEKKIVVTAIACCLSLVLLLYIAPKPGGEGVDLLRTASITARIESSRSYLTQLKTYQWLTGSGLYTTLPGSSEYTHARVPDNIFILILTSTGLVGTALAIVLVKRALKFVKTWQLEMIAALVALVTHAQFNNSILEPFIFLFMGMLIVTQFLERKNRFRVDTQQ